MGIFSRDNATWEGVEGLQPARCEHCGQLLNLHLEGGPCPDPTYVRAEIDARPVWAFAFFLSEVHNDSAPIGWGRYIPLAKKMLSEPQQAEGWDAFKRCEAEGIRR